MRRSRQQLQRVMPMRVGLMKQIKACTAGSSSTTAAVDGSRVPTIGNSNPLATETLSGPHAACIVCREQLSQATIWRAWWLVTRLM